ncbi:hypothetical protein ACRWQL_17180 [Shewanella sp. HL-SH4]|uniref:hypothetical protein n=1 Tax=Shewanella sp. HL-SH4 TaxID=3436240 RepID=UPI003EB99868
MEKKEIYKKFLGIGSITLFSQLIALTLMPLITKFYGPTLFGQYSVLLSIILLFTMLSTLNIQQDITKGSLVKYKYKINTMLFLSISFSISLVLLTLCFFILDIVFFHYLYVGLAVFVVSIYQIYYFSLIRNKDYKTLAKSTAFLVVSLPLLQILFIFFFDKDLKFLILSHFLSMIFSLAYMVHKLGFLISFNDIHKNFRQAKFIIKLSIKKYVEITFGRFLQLLNLQLPILLTALFLEIEAVAIIALSLKLVEVVARFIRSTIGNFILAENTVGKNHMPSYTDVIRSYKFFFFFSCLFLLLYLIISYFFIDMIFGNEWSGLGFALILLTPYFFANLVTSVFYYMMNIVKINNKMYQLELSLLSFILALYFVGYYMGFGDKYVLIITSILYFFYSIVMLVLIAKKVKDVRV